uniref:Uncharacterized protein n=1 Tax=Solanum lycopersicum TaxID=4081 RepID=A0A3Q7IEW5_SOLLC
MRIPTSKMPNVFLDVRQDLVYAYGCPSRLVRPIWKLKRAPKRAYPLFRRFSCTIEHYFLGDPDSDVKNAKFFCGYLSRPSICIRLAITACPIHLEGQMSPEASIPLISTIFVCYSTPFFGCSDSDVKNVNFFRGRPSRPFLCIQLSITAFPTHLEGQTSSEASIPLILMIFDCMAHHFLGDPDYDVKRAPKQAYPSFRRFSCAIAHHFLGDPDSDVKNAKFSRGRPSRPCLCMRLAITACPPHLEALNFLGDPDSDVKNAKNFRGRPSRPCLCIRLAITAFSTHFEGQTSTEASIPLISMTFEGFRRQKCQIFSWTSVKTFSMHMVGHQGLYDPFGMSNEPRSEHTLQFDDFHVL